MMKSLLRSAFLRPLALVMTVLGTAFGLPAPAAEAANVRMSNPDAVSAEVLGRALGFSVGYDRALNEDFVAGIGIGGVGTEFLNGNDAQKNATLIPLYVNYYFAREGGSLFATAGGTVITSSSDYKNLRSRLGQVPFPDSALMGTFGVGFETRQDAGFLFRGTAYGIAGQKLKPWVGVTFGYSF